MEYSLTLYVATLLLLLGTVVDGVTFSSLKKTISVEAVVKHNGDDLPQNVVKAGRDSIEVTWKLLDEFVGRDGSYKTVKAKLCFTKESQKDRAWRKTEDELERDKTCQKAVGAKAWSVSGNLSAIVAKDVPKAMYFIRVYVVDESDTQIAFGQTPTNSSIITVDPVTGRHASLDVATAVFSAFSVVALSGFFASEKYRSRRKAAN